MSPKSKQARNLTAFVASVFFISAAVGVSLAFASLTFTGTNITGDSGTIIDATGTITIGASSATGITIGRSGITATFPGTVTITGTTTTLQNLVVSGTCTGCGVGNFTAGGDLSGSSTFQTVIGIQGRAVSSTAPSANQVLTWNGSFWTPANTGSGITAINGLSNSTTSIVGAGTVTVSTSSPNVITITGTGSGAITINGLTTSTFQIQGTPNQITVSSSAPNIISLSLPQDIATGSSPAFANLSLTGNATTTNITISGISGSTQCLHVNANGVVSGTGSDCGSGGGSATTTINGASGPTFTFATSTQSGKWTISTSTGQLTFTLPSNVSFFTNDAGYLTSALQSLAGVSTSSVALTAGSNITITTSSNAITINATASSSSYPGVTSDGNNGLDVIGSVSTGVGTSSAGFYSLGQGTAPSSLTANAFTLFAPSSISAGYAWQVPSGANASSGVLHISAASNNVSALSISPVVDGDVSGTISVAHGGTGTSSPSLLAGSNITITGSWPDQTISSNASGTGGGGTGFNNGVGTGYQDVTEISNPGNPASGTDRLYLDSTTHLVTCLTSGVPGKFCTSGCEANWYGRSLVCHEERSMQRNRS